MYLFMGGANAQINSLAENPVLFRPITLIVRDAHPPDLPGCTARMRKCRNPYRVLRDGGSFQENEVGTSEDRMGALLLSEAYSLLRR
jgi:hypothetical protein